MISVKHFRYHQNHERTSELPDANITSGESIDMEPCI